MDRTRERGGEREREREREREDSRRTGLERHVVEEREKSRLCHRIQRRQ